PSRRAAQATARPWFPELIVLMPRTRSESVRCEIRFHTPRILNAPSRWRFSSFNHTGSSPPENGTVGVGQATSRTTESAESMSRIVTSIRSTEGPRRRMAIRRPRRALKALRSAWRVSSRNIDLLLDTQKSRVRGTYGGGKATLDGRSAEDDRGFPGRGIRLHHRAHVEQRRARRARGRGHPAGHDGQTG